MYVEEVKIAGRSQSCDQVLGRSEVEDRLQ